MATYKTVGQGPATEVSIGDIGINLQLPELRELIARLPNLCPRIEVLPATPVLPAPIVNYTAPPVEIKAPVINLEPADVTVNAEVKMLFDPKISVQVPEFGKLLLAGIIAVYLLVLVLAIALGDVLYLQFFSMVK